MLETNAIANRRIIDRPRLLKILEQAVASTTAIVAPPGYGKTTLARQWVRAAGASSFLWLQATDSSRDVAALAQAIVSSAGEHLPDRGRRILERVRAAHRPEAEVDVFAELILEDMPRGFTLLIDDYQHVEVSEASTRLVEVLADSDVLAVALTSRVRPRWATPRRILYGEVLEISRAALAMTPEEATQVLGESTDERALGLVALADGWPAVIGLAALSTSADVPTGETLQHYLAEELLSQMGALARSALAAMAFTPEVETGLLTRLLGEVEAEHALKEAESSGALQAQLDGSFQLQPLVRAYITEQPSDSSPEFSNWLDETSAYLSEQGRWDDLFALIERFGRSDLLDWLLRGALDDTLRGGRFVTLRRWVEHCETAGVSSGVTDLAAGELALREGAFLKAEALCRAAAEKLGREDALCSHALRTSGRAAHLASREDLALTLYAAAKDAASTESDRIRALWGEWSCATDLELDSAVDLKAALASAVGDDITDRVLFASWSIAMDARRGHVSSLDLADEMRDVIDGVDDPLVRCSFRNIYANGLSLSARYAEAYEVASKLHEDAASHRLEFVMSYAASSLGQALIGLGRYREAEEWLAEGHFRGVHIGDRHAVLNSLALYCRGQLAQGNFASAFDVIEQSDLRGALKSMAGEIVSCKALALACLGERVEAGCLSRFAVQMTSAIEPRILAAAASAIIELDTDREMASISDLVDRIVESGNLDGLVIAYRSVPRLAIRLAERPAASALLRRVAEQVGDAHLSRALGLERGGEERALHGISQRELEVYELLARGATNLEIAQRLFISEATVKAHVHHIFDKLGVRTRTEAAIHPAARRFR